MAQDRPTAAELIEAIREFLETRVRPGLEGQAAFHTRVAVNALGIVERQIEKGPLLDREEKERLTALLRQEGSLRELNWELCRRIRAGELGLDDQALIHHFWETTKGKLSIDNPNYSGYLRRLEEEDSAAGSDQGPSTVK